MMLAKRGVSSWTVVNVDFVISVVAHVDSALSEGDALGPCMIVSTTSKPLSRHGRVIMARASMIVTPHPTRPRKKKKSELWSQLSKMLPFVDEPAYRYPDIPNRYMRTKHAVTAPLMTLDTRCFVGSISADWIGRTLKLDRKLNMIIGKAKSTSPREEVVRRISSSSVVSSFQSTSF
jgi:hypothetical protein